MLEGVGHLQHTPFIVETANDLQTDGEPARGRGGTADVVTYARKSFPAERPLLTCLLDLNARIHADFTFDVTSV